MLLEPQWSTAFIGSYKSLLLELAGSEDKNERVLDALVRGRGKLIQDRSVVAESLTALRARNIPVDEEAAEAIQTLRVARWVYLRDTRKHSIFIDPAAEMAYGVVGLTNRIKEIIGGSGAVIETGLFTYKQRVVCDGLVSAVVWLGSNYRRSFNEQLSALREAGAFSDCALAKR